MPKRSIKSCPFCGSNNVFLRSFVPDAPGEYEPELQFICECDILIVLTDTTEDEAIKMYNRRASE